MRGKCQLSFFLYRIEVTITTYDMHKHPPIMSYLLLADKYELVDWGRNPLIPSYGAIRLDSERILHNLLK